MLVEGGKWYISYEDWPWGQYPRYFRGAAVLLPGITIGPLLAACQTTPYFPFDDTYLTGLCTSKAEIKVVDSFRYYLRKMLLSSIFLEFFFCVMEKPF